MVTFVAVTAVVLGVTLVSTLLAILTFLLQIRSLTAQTSAALDGVDEGATRLSGHLHRIQQSTGAAASDLATAEAQLA
jgi:hypothetical protein